MSSVVRAQHSTRCPMCRGWIAVGDNIVFVDDTPMHELCEPDFTPWAGVPEPVHHLAGILQEGHAKKLLDADFGSEHFNDLPPAIADALSELLEKEDNLYSLIRVHQGEHRESE